jgi:hypothetical protein
LRAIIEKGKDGSDSGSEDSDKSDKSDESDKSDDDDDDKSIPTFDKKLSDMTYYTLSNKNRTATYTYSSSNWVGTILATKSTKWCTRLGKNCGLLMLGMASKDIRKNTYNWSGNNQAYYFYCGTGGLYG